MTANRLRRLNVLALTLVLSLGACGDDDDAPPSDAGADAASDAGDLGADLGVQTDAGCPDEDGDGFSAASCGGVDCDDSDAIRYPGAEEYCDALGVDEDCNPDTYGTLDRDFDGRVAMDCQNVIDGVVTSAGPDCDDARASSYPGATEVCNGLDDDCDGEVDEGTQVAGFIDADGDGRGDGAMPLRACPGAAHFSVDDLDCDDVDPLRHRRMPELCDAVDNDCDGDVDESTSSVPWYADTDRDAFGNPRSAAVVSCAPIAGRSILAIDCDDGRGTRNPGAAETCNAADDDCDGLANFVIGRNDWEDDDDDGVPDVACAADPETADCDDRDPLVFPGAPERCNRRDDDCDGMIDEMCASEVPDGGVDDGGVLDGGRDAGPCPGLSNDVDNCGACGRRCRAPFETAPTCTAGVCGFMCTGGRENCDLLSGNGCEVDVATNRYHCGACGNVCFDDESCVTGRCVRSLLESTGAEGALEVAAGETRVLTAGRHDFTRVFIAAGGVLKVDTTGVLDLRATDDVVIAGTISVSGGNGSDSEALNFGVPGGGGFTGTGRPGAVAMSPACTPAGGGGSGVGGGDASVGCGRGGSPGGGGSGGSIGGGGGGGGGGYAGGAGGAAIGLGGDGAGFGGDTGGAGGPGPGAGGETLLGAPYAGGVAGCFIVGCGGGGGSIGASAAADLAVMSTFRPGSGGGGGSGGGNGGGQGGGGGGGGGGGALRVVSATRIHVDDGGSVQANGGAGGGVGFGYPGGGGGGAGGVIVLIAPEVRAFAGSRVSAAGGGGGVPAGGAGGLGRIRVSTDPARCVVDGALTPAPVAGCTPTAATAGRAYVGLYPE